MTPVHKQFLIHLENSNGRDLSKGSKVFNGEENKLIKDILKNAKKKTSPQSVKTKDGVKLHKRLGPNLKYTNGKSY